MHLFNGFKIRVRLSSIKGLCFLYAIRKITEQGYRSAHERYVFKKKPLKKNVPLILIECFDHLHNILVFLIDLRELLEKVFMLGAHIHPWRLF